MDHLRETVTKPLRLVTDGEPAGWARECLHSEIDTGNQLFPAPHPHLVRDSFSLKVVISGGRGRLSVILGGEDDTLDDEGGVSHDHFIFGDLSFDSWEELEETTHEFVRRGFSRMRADYRERYRDSNPTGLERQEKDLLALYRYLLLEEPIDRPTRDRLRRLTKKIGIDLPTKKASREKRTKRR